MILIKLQDGNLDLYSNETIQWSWTTFRFAGAIKDPYTNDFSIPKTSNNLRLLNVYSILDAPSQRVKKTTTPAIFQQDNQLIPIYIEVNEVTAKDIKIAIFENSFLPNFKDKNLKDYFTDDSTTIWEWISNSMNESSDYFYPYNYGVTYNYNKAQYHASMPIHSILQEIATREGINIEAIPYSYRLLASEKKVCPQNTRQALELDIRYMEGNYYKLYGGQHITNDCSVEGPDHITFNRSCTATMTFYCIWRKKVTTTQNKQIDIRKNGQLVGAIFLNSGSKREGTAIQFTTTLNFHEGDTFSIYFPEANKFQCASVLVDITYSNYAINEDDYGVDLRYVARRPGLDYYDGSTHTLYRAIGNTITIGTDHLVMPKLAFSYFGYWTNVLDITMGELFYELQWMFGKKVLYDYDRIYFSDQPVASVVEGEITEINPNSSYVGQKNYIRYMGQDTGEVTTIDNGWLEEEKDLHRSIFEFLPNNVVNQYSVDDEGKYTFNSISNPVMFRWMGSSLGAQLPEIRKLGMDGLRQSNEVKVKLLNPSPNITNVDVIYLDGREMFVIGGEKNDRSIILTALPIYKS